MENTTVQKIYNTLQKELDKLKVELKVDRKIYENESGEWQQSEVGIECKEFIDNLDRAQKRLMQSIDDLGVALLAD